MSNNQFALCSCTECLTDSHETRQGLRHVKVWYKRGVSNDFWRPFMLLGKHVEDLQLAVAVVRSTYKQTDRWSYGVTLKSESEGEWDNY